jgi:hypothetical protein
MTEEMHMATSDPDITQQIALAINQAVMDAQGEAKGLATFNDVMVALISVQASFLASIEERNTRRMVLRDMSSGLAKAVTVYRERMAAGEQPKRNIAVIVGREGMN